AGSRGGQYPVLPGAARAPGAAPRPTPPRSLCPPWFPPCLELASAVQGSARRRLSSTRNHPAPPAPRRSRAGPGDAGDRRGKGSNKTAEQLHQKLIKTGQRRRRLFSLLVEPTNATPWPNNQRPPPPTTHRSRPEETSAPNRQTPRLTPHTARPSHQAFENWDSPRQRCMLDNFAPCATLVGLVWRPKIKTASPNLLLRGPSWWKAVRSSSVCGDRLLLADAAHTPRPASPGLVGLAH